MNLVSTKISDGKDTVEVNVKELTSRLKSLASGCNIEVIQLAISSMIDELEDAVSQTEK
jgi:hypothetical protein